MKIRVVVPARVSADRKRCLKTCPGFELLYAGNWWCCTFGPTLLTDHLNRPLRCRACLRNEVKTWRNILNEVLR
jgi:hypothetical protein